MIIIVALTTFMGSCTKEGAKGETGASGVNGNANVKSTTFTVFASDWQTATGSFPPLFVNRTEPLITADIANSGAVMLYMQSTSSTQWQALPYTFPTSSSSTMYRFWHSENTLQINIYEESGTPTAATRTFKMVVMSSSARLANPNIDYTDYEQVKATFNLED